jgi:hypothetical protein
MRHGVFRCELKAITCQLVTTSDWSYELRVFPHWDLSSTVIERCHTPNAGTVASLRARQTAAR